MEAKAKAACVRALTELYKDNPEALVEAMEEMFGEVQVLPAEIEDRLKALEAVAHEQELLSPERWKEMIAEIKKHLRPDEEEEEEEEETPHFDIQKWIDAIKDADKHSPLAPSNPFMPPHSVPYGPTWGDSKTAANPAEYAPTVIC